MPKGNGGVASWFLTQSGDAHSGICNGVMVSHYTGIDPLGSLLFNNPMEGSLNIDTAVQAAQSLQPIAGRATGLLFTRTVLGERFMAAPVMTGGAPYHVAQVRRGFALVPANLSAGWLLRRRPSG